MVDGNELLSAMKRLRDVTASKDIPQLSYALFPGMHCPLFGATMAIRGIRDAVMLVVGTDECSYYSKHFSIRSEAFGGLGGRCVSAVLDTRDVTFGCKNMLDEAVSELVEEYHPKAVFLVTTCVVEVIGDDTDAMAAGYEQKYGLPFLSVHTEHFKCENHMLGLERTMTACLSLMKQLPVTDSCNILGQRMGVFTNSEPARILREQNIRLGMQLPCQCSVEEIQNAASAKVNLVVDPTGLPLAIRMKEVFGTPYLKFYRDLDPEDLLDCYRRLFSILERPLPDEILRLYESAAAAAEAARKELEGITYICGNTSFYDFECNAFFVSLGMIPQIIQTVSADRETDGIYIDRILEKHNPYVVKPANLAPLQYVYDVLHPHIYLGHESEANLAKKGIAVLRSERAAMKLGFELTEYTLQELRRAAAFARSHRKDGFQ